MLLLFLLISILALSNPKPAAAQLPILHQLFYAYVPDFSFSLGQVLGRSTTSVTSTSTPTAKTYPITVFGDSMIDTLGSQIPALQNSLKVYYPNANFKILNYGVGSQTIDTAKKRLTNGYSYKDQTFPSLISNQPDLVIIESFAYNNFGNTQDGINRHWLELGAVTTLIKQKIPHTKILLAATIAPNSTIFANNTPGTNFTSLEKIEKTKTIGLYINNLINFANSQKFPLADAYHPSLSGTDGNKSYINPADNIHPSPLGAQLFADTVAKAVFDNKLLD